MCQYKAEVKTTKRLVDSELGKDANFKSLQECIILIDRIANEAVKELKRTNANEVNFSSLPFTHDKEFTKALPFRKE